MTTNYKLFQVFNPDTDPTMGVFLHCTDVSFLKIICDKISKIIPFASFDFYENDLNTNQPYSVGIKKLKNQDRTVVWMINSLLCENGCKPLGFMQMKQGQTYSFILESD